MSDNKSRSKDYRDDRRDDHRNNRDSKNGRDRRDGGSRAGGGDVCDDRKRTEYRHSHHTSSTTSSSLYKNRDSRGEMEKASRSSSDSYHRSHRDGNKYDSSNERNRNVSDRDRYRRKRSPSPRSPSPSSHSSNSKRYSGNASSRTDRRNRSRSKSRETHSSSSVAKSRHERNNDQPSSSSSSPPPQRQPQFASMGGRTLSAQAAVGIAAAKIALELQREATSASPPSAVDAAQLVSCLQKQPPPPLLNRSTEALLTLPINKSSPALKMPPANLMPLMSIKTNHELNTFSSASAGAGTNIPSLNPPIALPSYYNPNIINPNKYAEQMQKRKLIWGAKKAEDTSAKWGHAKFSQDSDGKVASKFMRLMGIKSAPKQAESGGINNETAEGNVSEGRELSATANTATKDGGSSGVDVNSREAMFSKMEHQYEVARQVTHTMRGVGLGFSSQARPF